MRFFRIFLELTSSLSIAPGVDVGFKMKPTAKNKLGYDYFIPNKYFNVKHVLKVPEGYKFPDFPTQKNYGSSNLKEKEYFQKPYSLSYRLAKVSKKKSNVKK